VIGSDGRQVNFLAAFIRKTPDQMFQVLGRTSGPGDPIEAQILSSARSFRPLTDPGKLSIRPDRVHLVTVSRAGTFEDVVSRQRPLAITAEEASILNNIEPDENVLTGQLLKIVQPGRP
jgi:predicted Zn-dependent protease